MSKEKINKAYRELDRSLFMDEHKELAKKDRPFSIGFGQTISQPSLVLMMTLALNPKEDSRVLEIGTGSGYQTALLAEVSKEVFTVERIKNLKIRAQERLEKASYTNIFFKLDEGVLGWPEHGPFDRIMVTAAAHSFPQSLVDQLAVQGKMVLPLKVKGGQELLLIEKTLTGDLKRQVLENVRFVDLIGDY